MGAVGREGSRGEDVRVFLSATSLRAAQTNGAFIRAKQWRARGRSSRRSPSFRADVCAIRRVCARRHKQKDAVRLLRVRDDRREETTTPLAVSPIGVEAIAIAHRAAKDVLDVRVGDAGLDELRAHDDAEIDAPSPRCGVARRRR